MKSHCPFLLAGVSYTLSGIPRKRLNEARSDPRRVSGQFSDAVWLGGILFGCSDCFSQGVTGVQCSNQPFDCTVECHAFLQLTTA